MGRRMLAPGAAAALTLTTAGPARATDTVNEIPYQFTIRTAAAEHYFHFFQEVATDVGLSRVQLAQSAGATSGQSRALGAAYWLATDDAPCLLGCEPPCPDQTLINPTVARTTSPRECNDRVPGLSAAGVPTELTKAFDTGSASPVRARTPSDRTATGSSRVVNSDGPAGVQAAVAGSSASATIDGSGHYTGSADAFVTDLKFAGNQLATVTSSMRVTAAPGTLPKVDYLLSLATSGGSGWSSGVDQQSFTIAGHQVPLVDLVSQVNAQLAGLGSRLSKLADLGVRVLAPNTDYVPGTDRFRVSAPVVLIGVGPQLSAPTPTRDTGVRIGTAEFDGSYTEPDPPLR
jgi:hypothetical protein